MNFMFFFSLTLNAAGGEDLLSVGSTLAQPLLFKHGHHTLPVCILVPRGPNERRFTSWGLKNAHPLQSFV